jgi:hypothetical protein
MLPMAAVLASHACHAGAQELTFLGGMLDGDSGKHTYSWALDYQEGLGQYAAAGFTWYNEGHIPDHHRDGQSVQFWGRLPLDQRRLVLSAGAGPYRYFDTVEAASGHGYSDTHGWGILMSARAEYYLSSRWTTQLQINRAQVFGEPGTTSVMLGIGYQLEAPQTPGPRDWPIARATPVTDNEVTVLGGETILNSRNSPTALDTGVEYRRGLTRYLDWSASYLYEGSPQSVRRDGLATQLWLTRAFFDDRMTLSVGAGAYVAIDHRTVHGEPLPDDDRVAGLISMSASYRLSKRWLVRTTWNRVMTQYSRDTDVIQAGIGYRF